MPVILQTQEIYKEFSGEKLFSPLTFSLKERDRMAILGPNGCGKSTLIKMLMGKEEISGGLITVQKGLRIGYLSQDVIEDPNNTLYEEAMSVFSNIIEDEKKIQELSEKIALNPDNEKLLEEYSVRENQFQAEGGYDYKYKIALILNMFSFSKDDYERKIATFSGGEKTRLCFAKLLLLNPELLILDEPTNHLDIISIEWLEDYLASYQGSLLFVSHDITFVKKIANRILDFDTSNKSFVTYNCTYDNFAKEKQNRYELALQQFKAQEEQKEKLRRFIEFYKPKPRFVSRAKDREKKLERLEASSISDPKMNSQKKLSMSMNGKIREGKTMLEFSSVSIGYDTPLIDDISFTLYGQDRLAVMGANGCGKTTFGKVLINDLKPLSGRIRRYFSFNCGVLKQDIRSYSSDETLFDHFRNLYPTLPNQDIYAGLGRYGFSYTEANEKRLCNLSGGELMRCELLQLSMDDYDLLLLDEPTNHLDMMSVSELIDALNEYEGTLVIISHDRNFIDSTCNKLLYLYHGKGYYHEGSYDEFRNRELAQVMSEEREKLKEENLKKRELKPVNKTNTRTRTTRIAPEKILEKIDRLEKKKSELEALCEQKEYYENPDKLNEISESLKVISSEIEDLYGQLEKAM